MRVVDVLTEFDTELVRRDLRFEGVLVGGAALNLLGVVSRPTRDCDVLSPELPRAVAEAADQFAEVTEGVSVGWLNNGPALTLLRELPADWTQHTQPAWSGVALHFEALGRRDMIATKLVALCYRGGIDYDDCVALAPSIEELVQVYPYVAERDTHRDWSQWVRTQLLELGSTLRLDVDRLRERLEADSGL